MAQTITLLTAEDVEKLPSDAHCELIDGVLIEKSIAPDVVPEVVSPCDTAAEIQNIVREWIEIGVRMVWVVYGETRRVEVIRSLQQRFALTDADAVDGADVLPGFSCSVAELLE